MDLVAVTTEPKLNAPRLRADFPIFEQQIHGKTLVELVEGRLHLMLRHCKVSRN